VKTYSVPYQLAFSITPKLIYTSEANTLAFNGYSYTTQDFNGGESNVIFITGADSMSRLKNKINSIKISKEYSQKDKNQENIILSKQQSKSVRAEESKNKQDLDSNIEVSNEEKKFSKNPEVDNNFIEHQTNLQQVSFIDVSYPAFRENLLNLHLPRYHISSNVIQSQYYPYTRLELPLHNFGFYNPIVPLFYQTAAVISDSNSKSTSTAIKNIEASMESHVTKNSHTNVTSSESSSVKSSIESRFNLESTTNATEETQSSQSAISMKKLEFMIPVTSSSITSEKIREEITTSESIVTSQNSIEQITDNKANSTELASTETSSFTEKSSNI